MLIDGGGVRDGLFDPGARIVEPFLRARGIGRVDIVALSHPHPDHLNGLFRIARTVRRSARFWSSGDDGHNPEYLPPARARARRAASRRPTSSRRRLGGASVVPLGPFESDATARASASARPPG